MECKLYSELYGLDTVCLRYFNAYSEDQPFGGTYSTAISAWMEMIRRGNPLRIDGDGEQTRDLVHIEDIVSANILAQGGGNWIQSFMSMSDYTGSISLEMASYLRNGGDWSISGQGAITSPVNEIIPNEIISSGYNSGQLCLMFRFYEGYVTNYGNNAPRLVIEWEYGYVLGDINQDSTINIQDVILLINLILSEEFDSVADMNSDDTVNVLDVIQLVNIILN